MAYMAEIAEKQGWCDSETKNRIIDLLKLYEFDLAITFDKEVLYDIMKADKKRKGNFIDIVVPQSIGICRLQRITTEELGEIL